MRSKKIFFDLAIAVSIFIVCCLICSFYFKSNMLETKNLLAGITGIVIAYFLLNATSIIKKIRH